MIYLCVSDCRDIYNKNRYMKNEMKFTISKDFEFKLSIRKLAYWFICLYSVIFIFPEIDNDEDFVFGIMMLFGIISWVIIFSEKLLWKAIRGDKDFEIRNTILRVINSIFIILLGKYICPLVSSLLGLEMIIMYEKDNILIHIIGLLCITVCSIYFMFNFLRKTKSL